MRTSIQKKAVFVTILGTILFAGVAAQAQIFQTTSQSGANTLGWNAAIWGTPAAAPVNTTNYLTPATFDLRTPNTTTPGAFPGTSLIISNATLYLKHNNGVATVNLILAGPTTQTGGDIIDYHGGPGGTSVPLAGSLQVNANSEIESDQSGTANENIWLQSPLSGTGNLSMNMLDATHGVLLFGTNSAYSGNWTNITGLIEVMSGSSDALGSGSITLNFSTTTFLIFNSTNNTTVANLISGLGNVVQMNTGTVALTGPDTYTGYTEITN
ncbi:MAG TPA: hypothetical protein VNU95_00845, partial [Candidatus Acidoferrales bacterium]|nr:hypothetical protein [Candidatus Acidoferrales bacterium]